jgi:phage I-like protein
MNENLSLVMTDKGPRFYVRLGALADRITRIPIAVLGKFVKGAQKFAITLAEVVRNFRARGAHTVIDYEHASEFPEVAQGGPVPAAGWLTAVEDAPDADGVLWGTAEFTERAAGMIEAKEYKYLSPVIHYGAKDKTSGKPQGSTLLSMALTNRPFLDGMPAIAMTECRDARTSSDAATRTEKEQPKVKKLILADRVAGRVRCVADDDTETSMILEGLEAPPTIIRLSEVKRNDKGRYDFAAVSTGDVLIAGEVLRAMLTEAELDAALHAGKITPAQRPHFEKMALSDLSGFRELMKSMPTQVDLAERGVGGTGDEKLDHKVILTAIDKEIAVLRAANPKLDYMGGWRELQRTRPDLIKSYNAAAAAGGAK